MHLRWPFSLRGALLAGSLVVGIGLGGAGLGLAIANRADRDRPPVVGAAKGVPPVARIRMGAVPWRPLPGRVPPSLHDRVREPLRPGGDRREVERVQVGLLPGKVVEVGADDVLIAKSNGERRRVTGIATVRDELSRALADGREVTLRVRIGPDLRLSFIRVEAPRAAGDATPRPAAPS